MNLTLPRVAHEHHERLLQHVDGMPGFGDRLMTADVEDVRGGADDLHAFLSGTLIPHIDAAEGTLYPELERMLQNRHSMSPMRHEHDQVRRLVAEFGRQVGLIGSEPPSIGRRLALRRIVFELYAILKVHMAEEEAYLHVVEHGVTDDVAEVMAAALDHPGFRSV